jgi:hypothetical protein
MKKVYSVVGLILVLGLVALATASCKKAAGGGIVGVFYDYWEENEIDRLSDVPLGKATFGFNMKCQDVPTENREQALVTGQLQYNDHYNKIKFHGRFEDVTILDATCAGLGKQSSNNDFVAMGIYTTQHKGQFEETDSGSFYLYVLDNGEPGSSDADEFIIQIISGPYAGYTNFNPTKTSKRTELQGGNIQVFEK